MFGKILVPIDVGSETADVNSFEAAARLAKDYDAELHVIAVVPPFGLTMIESFLPQDAHQKVDERTQKALSDFVERASVPDVSVQQHVARGTIYEEILSAANSIGVDLIIMTAHGEAQGDFLLGPNAARVARHAKQSVLIVRG